MSHLYEVRGSKIYPTIHNDQYSYISFPVFEIRGNEVYPTIHNDQCDYISFPVFEIRGNEVYPTIHNDQYSYISSPVFEIRGDEVLSTTWNPHFSFGEPTAQIAPNHEEAGAGGSNDISFEGAAYAAAAGAGLFAALKTYEHVKKRRDLKARKRTDRTGPRAASAPPGWYQVDGELRYWNGLTWTEHRASVTAFPVQQPLAAPAVAAAPTNGVGVTLAWFVAVFTAGYMLPWAIAVTRGTSNRTVVGLVSLFLGWTVVGWIAALVMACAGRRGGRLQRPV